MRIFLFLMLLVVALKPISTKAQSAHMPLSDLSYHWLDRLDILYGTPTQLHTGIKGIWRKDIAILVQTIDTLGVPITLGDAAQMQWLIDENNEWQSTEVPNINQRRFIDSTQTFYTLQETTEASLRIQTSKRPVFKHFYKTPAHFFAVDKKDFYLRVNPLLNFRLSKDRQEDGLLFENQRGISIRGGIDQKVYFHTDILESQARFPGYVNDFRRHFSAVPGAGFYKNYISRVFDSSNGVDYLLANAYVGTSISKHVNIELGHGRHFIGNGIRSLFLSDFSNDYFYLKLNTRVWKFQYQNIFGELIKPRAGLGDHLLPKKYFAAHYLSFHLSRNIDIGLFETVVFSRENQFELQYLNPIILYRTVEGSIGSPDNVLLGIDVKWNIRQHVSIYSQFILDEFKISELTGGEGWWGNKYAFQAGFKYIDVLNVPQLDLQVEYNSARPYTYTHNTGIAHYSHYNQALAHPLGANFKETILRLTYQPTPQLNITLRAIRMSTGEDQDTLNWGSNILLPNIDRVQDTGNETGQGVATTISTVGLDCSYELRHGLYLDLFFQSRKKESALSARNDHSKYFGGGIRWNLGRRWQEF